MSKSQQLSIMKVNFQFISEPSMDRYVCGGAGKLLMGKVLCVVTQKFGLFLFSGSINFSV